MLRWAAALHETGISISYAGYHKHSCYILSQADMPGFSQGEQLRLARLVLAHRGKLDGTPKVTEFANTLEQVCIETVEAGDMTKDLAALISENQPWQTTEEFLSSIDRRLQEKMAKA